MHLLPDGPIFYAGSYNTHHTFPFSLSAFPTAVLDPDRGTWTDDTLPNEKQREERASVLLPPRPDQGYHPPVLLVGGGTTSGTEATADAELMDLGASDPAWRSVDAMAHCDAVLLPDDTVFVCGDREGSKGHADRHFAEPSGALPSLDGAVHEADRYDPASGTWDRLAAEQDDRLYHSNAVLLPDGRVMICGSNPARRVNELRTEPYQPPTRSRGPDRSSSVHRRSWATAMNSGSRRPTLTPPTNSSWFDSLPPHTVCIPISGSSRWQSTTATVIDCEARCP